MTNREFLQNKASSDLAAWLDQEQDQKKEASTDWSLFPSFQAKEFVCSCGKCEFSKVENVQDMSPKLLWILQAVRNKYGKPVTITCGARCKEFNASLSNSVQNSLHCLKRAADFYIPGVTSTEAGRDAVIAFMKVLPGYKYSYHNKNGSSPGMGSAVHIETK